MAHSVKDRMATLFGLVLDELIDTLEKDKDGEDEASASEVKNAMDFLKSFGFDLNDALSGDEVDGIPLTKKLQDVKAALIQ